MSKPKLLIIVLFQNLGDEQPYFARSPAPPLPGILIAGQTPDIVDVEVLHEMVRPIDYDTDADFIALSFMDYCAPHAYQVARRFQQLGKRVIAGGKYASTFPQKVIPFFDATVVGESERVWPQVVEDLVRGRLQKVYEAPFAPSLENIPPPRFDLVEPAFTIPVVTEATRGCVFSCSFCQLQVKPTPYRMRPIEDVIRDLSSTQKLPFFKRKMAMLLDNNLCGNLDYAKALLREIAKLRLWGLGVQFSFNFLHDEELLDLLVAANTGMVFIGLESLNEPSLRSVHKLHNRVEEYESLFLDLKRRGILTFTGMILGIDEDTPEYYRSLPANLERVDPSAILLSIAIPIPGTPLHKQLEEQGRVLDPDLSHYDGDHLIFTPRQVTPDQVFTAFRDINVQFYSWGAILRRWGRFLKAYLFNGQAGFHLFRAAVMSSVLFQLSRFQRSHARQRVYPMVRRFAGATMSPARLRFYRGLFLVAMLYDLAIGIVFTFFHHSAFALLEVTPPAGGYVPLLGAFLFVIGVAYGLIYRGDLAKNWDLILVGTLYKAAYSGIAFYFWALGELPHILFGALFGVLDLGFLVLMIECLVFLRQHRTEPLETRMLPLEASEMGPIGPLPEPSVP